MNKKRVAILLSRQALYPHGGLNWVRRTAQAVQHIGQRKHVLLTSIGMNTWELPLALAADQGIPVELIVPVTEHDRTDVLRWIDSQFSINPEQIKITLLQTNLRQPDRRELWTARDQYMVRAADVLYPIAVRKGGAMARLLDSPDVSRKVDRCLSCDYTKPGPAGYTIYQDTVNPELERLGSEYLYHWTRSASGPWPDETLLSYYLNVADSETYPRSAMETLRRIYRTGRILASARHMPGNTPTVSWTGLTPQQAVKLMRWRARYREMSFEPYGVGIRRQAADSLGVKPVEYADRKSLPTLSTVERWRCQSTGVRGDWRAEHEFRSREDFDLTTVEPEDMVLLVRRPREVPELAATSPVKVLSVTR